jgi:hypothetical protein
MSTEAGTGKIATFIKNFVDAETNIPVQVGATLEIIDWREDKVQCTTDECPIWVPREAITIS